MTYEPDFHPEASEEVVGIKRWYLERSTEAASRFDEDLNTAVARILEDPLRWRERSRGIRHYVMHRFPFYLAYRVVGAVVQVVAVAHGRRKPGYWRSRIGI